MKLNTFKFWLNMGTILALGLLIYLSRHQISDTFSGLSDLNMFWLVMIVPIQLANFYSQAMFYKRYLATIGEDVRARTLFKVALEMNFINHIFPSGGVSGFGYLALRLKKEGVPASKSTLTQVTKHSLTFISFILYLGIALILLAVFGSASRLMVLISTTIILLTIFGALLMVFVISSSARIRAFSAFLPKLINRLTSAFRRSKRPLIDVVRIEGLFHDLHMDYLEMKKNWRKLKGPFMWTLHMNTTELLTIFVIYLAFGSLVNPGALIIAYAVANIAGLISVLPGGVGVYEALMAAVLTSAGIPRGLAISTTLVYRILTMVIFLPIGLVLYQVAIRSKPDLKDAVQSNKRIDEVL